MAMTDDCNTGSHEVCSGLVEEEDAFAVPCSCGCHAHVWPTGHVPIGQPAPEPEGEVTEESLAPPDDGPAPDEESISDEVPAEAPA